MLFTKSSKWVKLVQIKKILKPIETKLNKSLIMLIGSYSSMNFFVILAMSCALYKKLNMLKMGDILIFLSRKGDLKFKPPMDKTFLELVEG